MLLVLLVLAWLTPRWASSCKEGRKRVCVCVCVCVCVTGGGGLHVCVCVSSLCALYGARK